MNNIIQAHGAIYTFYQSSRVMQAHFSLAAQDDAYATYYTSMYLIQDTSEAVCTHMRKGFPNDPMQAYIDFWGIMQALSIQQDAICELHKAILGKQCNTSGFVAWTSLRDTRNLCVGHPANRAHGRPKPQRAFMGRNFGVYSQITYEVWDAHSRQTSHQAFDLAELIKRYDTEASGLLLDIFQTMKRRWP